MMASTNKPMPRSTRPNPKPGQPKPTSSLTASEQLTREEETGDLSYQQARTALELVLAQLQASDLDVETMASLYRQGQSYAKRCDTILEQVEQEILMWDCLADPDGQPGPYSHE